MSETTASPTMLRAETRLVVSGPLPLTEGDYFDAVSTLNIARRFKPYRVAAPQADLDALLSAVRQRPGCKNMPPECVGELVATTGAGHWEISAAASDTAAVDLTPNLAAARALCAQPPRPLSQDARDADDRCREQIVALAERTCTAHIGRSS